MQGYTAGQFLWGRYLLIMKRYGSYFLWFAATLGLCLKMTAISCDSRGPRLAATSETSGRDLGTYRPGNPAPKNIELR